MEDDEDEDGDGGNLWRDNAEENLFRAGLEHAHLLETSPAFLTAKQKSFADLFASTGVKGGFENVRKISLLEMKLEERLGYTAGDANSRANFIMGLPGIARPPLSALKA